MENDQGQTKSFLVTDLDARTITIDGNNPLAGREVIFEVTIGLVRAATEREIEYGGKVPEQISGGCWGFSPRQASADTKLLACPASIDW